MSDPDSGAATSPAELPPPESGGGDASPDNRAEDGGENLTPRELAALGEASDEDLMKGCQEGSIACYDELFARYSRQALSFVHRILGDFQHTESLTQEAFMRIFRNAASYEYPRPFSTWFYTILRNLTKNELRYRSRHPSTSIEEEIARRGGGSLKIRDCLAARGQDPLEGVLENEVEDRLRKAIDELPDDQREILILHRFQKLKYREIVEVVGQPLGSVRRRLHRAINRLRKAIQDLL